MAPHLLQRSNFDFTWEPASALDREQESGPKTSNPMDLIYRRIEAISRDSEAIDGFIDILAVIAPRNRTKDCDTYQCHRQYMRSIFQNAAE